MADTRCQACNARITYVGDSIWIDPYQDAYCWGAVLHEPPPCPTQQRSQH